MTIEHKALKERTANLLYSEQQKKVEKAETERKKQDLLQEHDKLAADVFAAFNAMRNRK